MPADEPSLGRLSRPRPRWLSIAAYAIGLALLAAAVWTVSRQSQTLQDAWASVRAAPAALKAAALILPLLNWLLTALTFWVLTRRYGRIGPGEMAALIASAWLLNLLPLRPGMFGRLTYHKAVNGIRFRDSAAVLLQAIACTVSAALILLAVVLIGPLRTSTWGSIFAILAPAPVLALAAALTDRRRGINPRLLHLAPRFIAAIALRYADVLGWTVRYILVFSLVGHPIDLPAAAVIAAASQAAMAAPIQLGVREWLVGIASTIIPTAAVVTHHAASARSGGDGGAGGALAAAAPGLAADLVNRAAELLVLVPVGAAATLWLWGRARANAAAGGIGAGGGGSGEGEEPRNSSASGHRPAH